LLFVSPAARAEAAAPLPIVTSFSILGDMVKQVGGDLVAVTALVGPDGDAHGYQPTSTDMQNVSRAKLVVVNGLGFDSWMKNLMQSAQYKGPLLTARTGIPPLQLEDGHDDHHGHDHEGQTDPHGWQDLRNGMRYVDAIAAALAQALPDHAAAINERAARYKDELNAEDKAIRSAVATIPSAQRLVITSHDAFGYFGAAYDVRFAAPQGLSTETEISAKSIAKLVRQIKSSGVKTVFIENMSNPRLIQQLGKDAGAKLGGTLYADALSPPDGPAPTYLGMFRHNAPLLIAAMQQNKAP
jgi:zinc/manganese transport system substrate-binding protein